VTRYFAYGSNMSTALMKRRCPSAVAIDTARLDGWRFFIMVAGFASIAPANGSVVHGVLWWLAPRDLAALNAYEGIEGGLYVRRTLPVRRQGRHEPALVYVGTSPLAGRPRPAYQWQVAAAARQWQLPADYVRALERFAPAPPSTLLLPETVR
jgi:cation transport regulator ChaC